MTLITVPEGEVQSSNEEMARVTFNGSVVEPNAFVGGSATGGNVHYSCNQGVSVISNPRMDNSRFSTHELLRHKWVFTVRVERSERDWMPTKRSTICSSHFKEEDKYNCERQKKEKVEFSRGDPVVETGSKMSLNHTAVVETHPSQVTHPTTYTETLLHVLKGNIGSGLLAMGDAFKNGGIVFAPIVTIILGLICVHCQHILLNCSNIMSHSGLGNKRPSYAETVGLCFQAGPMKLRRLSRPMCNMVNVFLCVTQIGFCCVYVIFIATNFQPLFDQYVMHFGLPVHMVFALTPLLLSCMVRNLKYITLFSTLANILMIAGVSAVIYKASQDLPPIDTRVFVASWQQLPLYFSTVIYAFEGIGLVLPLKNEMKKPELFQKPLGVLNVGMVCVGSINIVVGFLGYLKWGDEVAGSVTLNLEAGNLLSNLVQGSIAFAILLTYPLQMYVPVAITLPKVKEHFTNSHFPPVVVELGYRAMLVILTFILAELIPQLGLFISLVGAVSSTALALMFPPLIEVVLKSRNVGGCPQWLILKNFLIMLLGIFIFVTGTYQSIVAIVIAFTKKI